MKRRMRGRAGKALLGGMLAAWMHTGTAETFTVQDIEVQGLQRITAGTVFTYLPVKVGDAFDEARSAEIVRALYRTGFFSDVSLDRREGVLVVTVVERPAISDIRISGNTDIKTDQLLESLASVNIARGRVFDPSVLERMENELRQQYFARGKYNVRIDTRVEDLERNRVDVIIDIGEGKPAEIRQVNIVGNEGYDIKKLLKLFDSGVARWYDFFSSRGEYSRQVLSADLEKLRSHYLDHGYANFNIDSTQVTITPDRRDIYITVNVAEGDQYTISGVALAGELLGMDEELQGLIGIEPGAVFSRGRINAAINRITRRLGDDGHAFANVNPIPTVDHDKREVAMTLFVDPGRRVYVRRVNFTGNQQTRDEVFRREMRQIEGGWYNASAIERSRVRLQRLSFVETVNIETQPVAGTDDQVDLEIGVKERMSGSFMVGAGYSQSEGFLLNLSLTQENFMGSGSRLAANFNNSSVNTIYSLSYTNPYYTIDGVSRGFSGFYSETDASELEISRYSSTRYGGTVSYGIPITEHDSVRLTPGYERVRITTVSITPNEITNFLTDNGNEFDLFSVNASFVHDTRNRTVFADRGNLQRVSLEATVPGSDLQYYKVDYRNQYFWPVRDKLTLMLTGDLGIGDSYGDTTDLPFFEKYFAGGVRSVRGFRDYSLGPRDSRGDPFGGNFKMSGSLELLFPPPFMEDDNSLRVGVFIDAGNVFARMEDVDLGEMRASTGVSTTWLSPVGALTFSLAKPLVEKSGDDTQFFQFTVGTSF